jgi:aspartate aminotransferase
VLDFAYLLHKAEERITASRPDKEYLPITGLTEFNKRSALLAYGADSVPLKQDAVRILSLSYIIVSVYSYQIAITQSISGTGALRIGAAFLARHYPYSKTIYLPVPSWGNHTPIFRDSGLEVRGYRYFDKSTVGLDFEGLKADLQVRGMRFVLFS